MLKLPGSNIMKFQQQSFLILILLLFSTLDLMCSQTFTDDCVLDFKSSYSSLNNSNCELHSWGSFVNSCCGLDFRDYLYALGLQANQTGKIFLNSSEQEACIAPIELLEKNNVSSCGIEKLTSGAGGCSDYTVIDVVNKLGGQLRRLEEDCMPLSNDAMKNETCTACLRGWEDIIVTSDSETEESESADTGNNLCRFAVLISLTSMRIYDRDSIQAVYECLGTHSLSADKQEGKAGGNAKLSPGLWILSFGLIVATAIVLLAAAWIWFRKRKRSLTTEDGTEFEDSTSHSITIKEVYAATNNLSASNYLGQGIAGKVYKGKLSNGQHVAVKHITNEACLETFIREVTSASHVRHPNLVTLLGYCKNEDECFLVYELCHKGSLSEWLFGILYFPLVMETFLGFFQCKFFNTEFTLTGKYKILPWIQRLKIAVDSARGLVYLHTYPGGCIIHRDIKPSNILIDNNFQAKVSDFGLSRVMDLDQSFVSSEVRGTLGYIDPEYRKNHHVNALGDVYSFGIVLLQLLSGQRIINYDLQRPMSLNKMARNFARGGNISEFADPKLKGEFSVEAFDITLKLALSCIGLKQQRPSIEQVLHSLERALHISLQAESFKSCTQ